MCAEGAARGGDSLAGRVLGRTSLPEARILARSGRLTRLDRLALESGLSPSAPGAPMPSPRVLVAFCLALLAAFAGASVPAARADTLELVDGRVVEGRVTKDGEAYRVVSRYGEATVA